MMKCLITIYLSFVIYDEITIAESTCEGKDGVICCYGYKWSEQYKTCIKCSSGYLGLNCSKVCPYPTYGERCSRKCNCERHTCHHEVGCVNKFENTFKHSESAKRNTTSRGFTHKNHITSRSTVSPSTARSQAAEATESNYPSSMEEKLRLIINRLSTNPQSQTGRRLQVPLQIGMASTLLLLFVLIVVYLVKRGAKCGIPLKSKSSKILSEDSDPYLYLEDMEQLSPSGTPIFNGLAEVRMNYDDEQKLYTLGLRTQSVRGEGPTTHEITNHIQWNGAVHTPVTTSHLTPTCTPDRPMSGEHNKYLEIKACAESRESDDPYLHVVSDGGQNNYQRTQSPLVKI
ncbi:uncharacterized protein LOC125661495 [Ostrea edulis]|uniref:uncharacterized protein LOC125661495 n=1 Tax=Ostrea edulis TaxID=37623 RepID=UPI0024AF5EE0|nr:uncharacterized protein LOC125661495 [Ostrea edulis]